jgi:hypothetical protein
VHDWREEVGWQPLRVALIISRVGKPIVVICGVEQHLAGFVARRQRGSDVYRTKPQPLVSCKEHPALIAVDAVVNTTPSRRSLGDCIPIDLLDEAEYVRHVARERFKPSLR